MDYLIHHMLRTSASRFPNKEALVHGSQRLTYLESASCSAAIANSLRTAGVKRSDRIGIFLAHGMPFPLSIFGISQAGGAFVPIHQSLYPDQVKHIVNDCEMTALVTDASKLNNLQEVIEECPSLQFIVVVGPQPDHSLSVPIYKFDDFCTTQARQSLTDVAIEKDLAAILYTSGSTGKPKGVMLSHANVLAGASIVSEYLEITDADKILAVLPYSFDAGLNQLTTAIQQGATCVSTTFLFAKDIVNIAVKENITGLAGVPSLWSLLAQPSSTLKEKCPALRYITNTGGAMPLNVLAHLRKAIPETKVYLMYGLTEAFRSTYLPPHELDRHLGSIGKAIPNTEIMVVHEEGRPCKPGETGELVHHGPTVSLGYWGQPELTNRVLRSHPFPSPGAVDGDKVCYSGDLVRIDEEGFMYFVGRRDNLIKSSGFRVSPTEVEAGLCKSGKLAEAAVIGIPDDVLGHHIKAFVVPNEGTTVNANELLAHCAGVMPRYMVPKSIELLDTLPRTASGKVNYPILQKNEQLALE